MGVRKQAQISPPPFFLRLSPIGGSGWEPSHPAAAKSTVPQVFSCSGSSSDGKIHRRRRCSAVRAAAATAKSTADGKIHRRRQNPPPTQVFSCSGSSSDGKIHRRRRCSAVRAPSARARAAKRPQVVQLVGLQQQRRQNPPHTARSSSPAARRQNPPHTARSSSPAARRQNPPALQDVVQLDTAAGMRLFFSLARDESTATAAGMRLFSALQETNPPPRPQAFSCSGSISEGEGSKTAADVQLFGLHGRGQQNGHRCSAVRAEGSKTATDVQLFGQQRGRKR